MKIRLTTSNPLKFVTYRTNGVDNKVELRILKLKDYLTIDTDNLTPEQDGILELKID